jgi:hypothetical protein
LIFLALFWDTYFTFVPLKAGLRIVFFLLYLPDPSVVLIATELAFCDRPCDYLTVNYSAFNIGVATDSFVKRLLAAGLSKFSLRILLSELEGEVSIPSFFNGLDWCPPLVTLSRTASILSFSLA